MNNFHHQCSLELRTTIDDVPGNPFSITTFLYCNIATYRKSMLCTRMMDTFPIWMIFFNSLKTSVTGMLFCETHYMAVIHVVLIRQCVLNLQIPGDNMK